jgi:hypothetical protein
MSRAHVKIAPRVGDVFLIPLDETSYAGGHVIAIRENAELYVAVFGHRLRHDEIDPEAAIAGDPVLLTLTFDAKLFHGEWPIIGNLMGATDRYPDPAFKIKHAGVMNIESRDKSVRRPAGEDELEFLQYRSVGSPMIIEDAIKAHFGIGRWSESYNKRLAEYAVSSSKLI